MVVVTDEAGPESRLPTPRCSTLASVAAVGAVGLVASEPDQLVSLAVEGGGLLVLLSDPGDRRHGGASRPLVRPLVGTLLLLGSFPLALAVVESAVHRAELLPGMVGVAVLAAGLLRSRPERSRWFVVLGTAGVTLSVLASAVLHEASMLALIAAMTGTIVAWDAGVQAVDLGGQVGTPGTTAAAELVHTGGSMVVGMAGVVAAVFVYTIGATGLPLDSLVLLLGAGLMLLAALFVLMLEERPEER